MRFGWGKKAHLSLGRRRPRIHEAPSQRDRNQSRPWVLAIVLLDQAGWLTAKALIVSSNLSLLLLPPGAPELNGQERCQFMRPEFGCQTGQILCQYRRPVLHADS
jgi:hypothetical protein